MAHTPTLRHLRYFVTAYDSGHFGRAAEACPVTQPTLFSAPPKAASVCWWCRSQPKSHSVAMMCMQKAKWTERSPPKMASRYKVPCPPPRFFANAQSMAEYLRK